MAAMRITSLLLLMSFYEHYARRRDQYSIKLESTQNVKKLPGAEQSEEERMQAREAEKAQKVVRRRNESSEETMAFGIEEKCLINKHVFCRHLSPNKELDAIGLVPNMNELQKLCPDVLKYFECVTEHSEVCGSQSDSTAETVEAMYSIVQEICTKDSKLHKDYSRHFFCYKSVSETRPGLECEGKAEAVYNSYLLHKSEYSDDVDDADRTVHRYCMEQSYKIACISTKILKECGGSAHEMFVELIQRSKYLLPICSKETVKEIKDEFVDYLDEEEEQQTILRRVSDF